MKEANAIIQETEQQEEQGYAGSLLFRTYSYRENLFVEFEQLVQEGRRFDGLIIDLMQTGYSLPLDVLVKFYTYAKRLLKPRAVLLLIKATGALTLTHDDPGGGLTLNVYDSPFGIFARYPMLADYVCATVSGIDRRRLRSGGNTLANHILYTSMPVLTSKGATVRKLDQLPSPLKWLLKLIDDYATTEAIALSMENKHSIHFDETFRLLQELETEGIIFPIFSRIQFLANCYHNRKPFRLGRYMVAAGIITPSQLEELLEIQQEQGWENHPRSLLGMLAVRQNYVNSRELEVLLHDQYLYGGYHKVAEDDDSNSPSKRNIETMRDSMIGSLGAIDSAGLLQSISTAKKTGLLTAENRDKVLIVAFNAGRPTHARLDKLQGYDAIVEFLVTWKEGIFVFRDKGSSQELDNNCALSQPLDRMLIDAALYQDQMNSIIAALPNGRNSMLERVQDFNQLWSELISKPLTYVDKTKVTEEEKNYILRIADIIDGLTALDEVVKTSDYWPSHMVFKSIHLLLDHKLINAQQTSLFRPLTAFQRIAAELQNQIGTADNKNLLETSLYSAHRSSSASSRFHIDNEGRVSINLSQVKHSGVPVSQVLLELRHWMEAYLTIVRQKVSPQIVDSIVARIIHASL